jgi:hypothetical protein
MESEDLKSFEEKAVENGIFSYTEDGFIIKFKTHDRSIKWSDIETIIAYKRDLMTTDQICFDLFYQNSLSSTISEDTEGWSQFVNRMQEAFPQIDKDWWGKIIHPAFKTNMTLLYDKQRRNLEEVVKTSYK